MKQNHMTNDQHHTNEKHKILHTNLKIIYNY